MRVILALRCHYCGKDRSPSSILQWGGGVRICSHCYELHGKRIQELTENPPAECPGCRLPFGLLQDDGAGNVSMRMMLRDGQYQLLCLPCADAYEMKAASQFKGTIYGKEKGLV